MIIAHSEKDVVEYMGIITRTMIENPVLIDKYMMGKEVEVDAICDGTDFLIPGIMEHIERAGIHSGDSVSVYPAKSLTTDIQAVITDYTRRLARALHVRGLINIQFIVCEGRVYVIEVNPRSSRTVPYISKVTGIPIIELAVKVMNGAKLSELGYGTGLAPAGKYYAVKMPVFSFEKIRGAEISLGPEMKSTGECLGIAGDFVEALYKAFLGAGVRLPKYKKMILSVRDQDKEEAVEIGRRFSSLGYQIYATQGTHQALEEVGVMSQKVGKMEEESPNILDLILDHEIDLIVDPPQEGAEHAKDGFVIRRNAIETGVNVLTAIDTARALADSLQYRDKDRLSLIDIAKDV